MVGDAALDPLLEDCGAVIAGGAPGRCGTPAMVEGDGTGARCAGSGGGGVIGVIIEGDGVDGADTPGIGELRESDWRLAASSRRERSSRRFAMRVTSPDSVSIRPERDENCWPCAFDSSRMRRSI
jgi:hypothetical protein